MTWYVPVLSGRRAEVAALSAAREAVGNRLRPVLEIAPGNGEPPEAAIRRLVEHHTWAPSIGLDCRGYYADSRGAGTTNLLPGLAETLAEGTFPLPVLPVLWPDSPERLIAEAAAVAAGTGAGVYLRVPIGPTEPGAAERILERARLLPLQTDLLLDLGEVAKDAVLSAAVERAVAVAEVNTEGWRSVTVLSGGWPSRRRLPLPPAVTVLPRNDAALWTKVQAALPALPLGFGDFGVRARSATGGGGRNAPAPYLRYTVDDTWELRRWPKTPEGGLETIQPLCEELIRSSSYLRYGQAYSWGDAEIARAAAPTADRRSPSAWVAWSVSHHLAVVADRLRSVGTP